MPTITHAVHETIYCPDNEQLVVAGFIYSLLMLTEITVACLLWCIQLINFELKINDISTNCTIACKHICMCVFITIAVFIQKNSQSIANNLLAVQIISAEFLLNLVGLDLIMTGLCTQ